MSPWLSIALLGIAITGYAWMMPKSANKGKETEFVSEAAYDRLLEDLELENRELVDAVAKFKREQDATVDKLGRRIVEMEDQMRAWNQIQEASAQTIASRVPSQAEEAFAETIAGTDGASETLATAPDVGVVTAPLVAEEPAIPSTSIRRRYSELLDMHEKGRSVEQIAKAMGMNKGEVQLILQLVRREEEQHA